MFNIFGINSSIFCERWGAEFRKRRKENEKADCFTDHGVAAVSYTHLRAHDSLFKDWYHVKFSWGGYKNSRSEDAHMSADRGWWGEEIPYIPAE